MTGGYTNHYTITDFRRSTGGSVLENGMQYCFVWPDVVFIVAKERRVPLAQWSERWSYVPKVAGSSPVWDIFFVLRAPLNENGILGRKNASAGNRTRVTSMATMYSTTRPLMLTSSTQRVFHGPAATQVRECFLQFFATFQAFACPTACKSAGCLV